MVVAISVDTSSFLEFSGPNYHHENTEASPSAVKSTKEVLVPYPACNFVRTTIFSGVDISKVPEL